LPSTEPIHAADRINRITCAIGLLELASELVWMPLGLSAKLFPRARAALADEARDLVRNLVRDFYFA
jgi:hypothetical protein